MANHPSFKRDGPDVLADISIPLSTALLGGVVRIPTIDGDVDLNVPAGIQPEEKRVLRRRGVQKLNRKASEKGDHWVTFKIDIPKKLTDQQRELIMEAFKLKDPKSPSSTKKPESSTDPEESKDEKRDKGFFGFFKSKCQDKESDSETRKKSSTASG